MPDYPLVIPDPDQLPTLTEALIDLTLLEEYFRGLEVTSRASIGEYFAAHLKFAELLGAGRDVLNGLRRLKRLHTHKRRNYVLRPVRLAEAAPWPVVLRRFLTWDRSAHRRYRPGTVEWAVTLRDRAILWILLVAGPRIENLVALRANGAAPNLVRDEAGRISDLLLRESETKNNVRVTVPIGRVRGVADLLQALVDEGLSLFPGGDAGGHEYLILTKTGRPYDKHSLRKYLKHRLFPDVFGNLTIYPHYLRRIAVAILRDGYGLSFAAIAKILGHEEETARKVYYIFTPQAATQEYAAAFSDGGEIPEPNRALINDLKAWLKQLADDFGGAK